jgi:hypothetical protein
MAVIKEAMEIGNGGVGGSRHHLPGCSYHESTQMSAEFEQGTSMNESRHSLLANR